MKSPSSTKKQKPLPELQPQERAKLEAIAAEIHARKAEIERREQERILVEKAERDKGICREDPVHFIDEFCQITTPAGENDIESIDTAIPFKLWPCQKDLVGTLQTEKQVIILKARRLGITWTLLAFALWMCTFFSNRYVIVLSTGEKAAANLIKRVKFMHAHLPEPLRERLVVDHVGKLEFANGSVIEAFPDTEDAGRQETASLVIGEEHASQNYARQNYASVKPTIEGGGQVVLNSTSKGKRTLHAELEAKAFRGKSKYKHVFLGALERPDRTREWLESEREEYNSEATFKREYPLKREDAYLSPEGQYWSDYDGQVHLRPGYKAEFSLPIWRSVDFGLVQPSVHWHQETAGDTVVTFGELSLGDITTQELKEAIFAYEDRRGWDPRMIKPACCDPAGKGRNPQTGESDLAVFHKAETSGKYIGRRIPTIERTSAIIDGCNIMHTFLRQHRWFIDPDECPWLVSALEDAVWDKDKNGELRSEAYKEQQGPMGWSHCLDEVRYYFVNRWLEAKAGPAPQSSKRKPATAGIRKKEF